MDVVEEMLSVRQVSELMGVSTHVIYRMINEGVLPAYRPSPRRTWLRRCEVLAAFAVPAEPRVRRPEAPPMDASRSGDASSRRSARRPSTDLAALMRNPPAYAHLLRSPKRD